MSTLILTDQEKAAQTWLELPDKAIADAVRNAGVLFAKVNAKSFVSDVSRPLVVAAAMHICIEAATSSNAARSVSDFHGLSLKGEMLGSYRLTIERLDDKGNPEEVAP